MQTVQYILWCGIHKIHDNIIQYNKAQYIQIQNSTIYTVQYTEYNSHITVHYTQYSTLHRVQYITQSTVHYSTLT